MGHFNSWGLKQQIIWQPYLRTILNKRIWFIFLIFALERDATLKPFYTFAAQFPVTAYYSAYYNSQEQLLAFAYIIQIMNVYECSGKNIFIP